MGTFGRGPGDAEVRRRQADCVAPHDEWVDDDHANGAMSFAARSSALPDAAGAPGSPAALSRDATPPAPPRTVPDLGSRLVRASDLLPRAASVAAPNEPWPPPGAVLELSGGIAAAVTSAAVFAVVDVQHTGGLVAWVQRSDGTLFPPDLAANDVDLDALVIVQLPANGGRVPESRAAESRAAAQRSSGAAGDSPTGSPLTGSSLFGSSPLGTSSASSSQLGAAARLAPAARSRDGVLGSARTGAAVPSDANAVGERANENAGEHDGENGSDAARSRRTAWTAAARPAWRLTGDGEGDGDRDRDPAATVMAVFDKPFVREEWRGDPSPRRALRRPPLQDALMPVDGAPVDASTAALNAVAGDLATGNLATGALAIRSSSDFAAPSPVGSQTSTRHTSRTSSRGADHVLPQAAELLLRSGAFDLLVLDLRSEPPRAGAWLGRLQALAREHGTRVLLLTEATASLVFATGLGQRIEPVRTRSGDAFAVALQVRRDKLRAPVPPPTRHRGPLGT